MNADKIASELREQIRVGTLSPGDRLPTIEALVEHYGVATQTARLAISTLKAEGLVEHLGGRAGTVVRAQRRRRMVTRTRQMERDSAGYYSGPEVQDWARVAGTATGIEIRNTPKDIAEFLGIPEGTEVLVRSNMTGDPEKAELRHMTDIWLHPDVTRALPVLQGSTGPGGTQDRIEEWSGKPLAWSEVVSAHSPSPEERKSLLLPTGIPVLRIIRIATIGRSSRVASVDDIRMSSELFGVRYSVGRGRSAKWPVTPARSDYYSRPAGAADLDDTPENSTPGSHRQ